MGRYFTDPHVALVINIILMDVNTIVFIGLPRQVVPVTREGRFTIRFCLPGKAATSEATRMTSSVTRVLRHSSRMATMAAFVKRNSPHFRAACTPRVKNPGFTRFVIGAMSGNTARRMLSQCTSHCSGCFPSYCVHFGRVSCGGTDCPVRMEIDNSDVDSLGTTTEGVTTYVRRVRNVGLVHAGFRRPLPNVQIAPSTARTGHLNIGGALLSTSLTVRFNSNVPVSAL